MDQTKLSSSGNSLLQLPDITMLFDYHKPNSLNSAHSRTVRLQYVWVTHGVRTPGLRFRSRFNSRSRRRGRLALQQSAAAPRPQEHTFSVPLHAVCRPATRA